jgi:prepilin-type N-terminal cleavage/methylation domain-containing protein
MSGRGRRRSRAGFTITELIVAVMLLSVGALGMAGMMVTTSARHRLTTAKTEMDTHAISTVEQLRAAAHARTADTVLLAVGGSLSVSQSDHADTIQVTGSRKYVRRWVVQHGPAGTRRLTVRVQPVTRARYVPSSRDFTTLILIQ